MTALIKNKTTIYCICLVRWINSVSGKGSEPGGSGLGVAPAGTWTVVLYFPGFQPPAMNWRRPQTAKGLTLRSTPLKKLDQQLDLRREKTGFVLLEALFPL